jgi:ADP-ribosylation factor-like protein 2
MQTDGVVWVVDSADRRRLQNCKEELHSLLLHEKLAGASLLIFCNKQDLAGALSPKEIAEVLELDGDTFGNRHWAIQPCSAVTGDGLVTGVDWMVNDISARIFMMS